MDDIGLESYGKVGARASYLGELRRRLKSDGVNVPQGFACSGDAYSLFLESGGLRGRILAELRRLEGGRASVSDTAASIREMFIGARLPGELSREIRDACEKLREVSGQVELRADVRISPLWGPAGRLPEAFASAQEAFLNVAGELGVIGACVRCYASLFSDEALLRRAIPGVDDSGLSLPLWIQASLRPDLGASGTALSYDKDDGFPDMVVIEGAWGFSGGSNGGSGVDKYIVYKPLLKERRVKPVIRRAGEKAEPGGGMDAVSTDNGDGGAGWWSGKDRGRPIDESEALEIAKWTAAAEGIFALPVQMRWVKDGGTGELFVTDVQPAPAKDQEREDGPRATRGSRKGASVADVEALEPSRASGPPSPEEMPEVHTGITLDVSDPAEALRCWNLPVRGVGLARTEHLVRDVIGVHPLALLRFDELEDGGVRERIESVTRGYDDKGEYFVDVLAGALACMSASYHSLPAIVRFCNLDSSEYSKLIGGSWFEPGEKNPLAGLRGAGRYISEHYRPAFELECRALKRVRDDMGFENTGAMIPFCRTIEEAQEVLSVMRSCGLERGSRELEVHLMVQVPSNFVMDGGFMRRFDGLSLTMEGIARPAASDAARAGRVPELSREMTCALPDIIRDLLETAHDASRPVSFCGNPMSIEAAAMGGLHDFTSFLIEVGIDSVCVRAEEVVEVMDRVAAAERGE